MQCYSYHKTAQATNTEPYPDSKLSQGIIGNLADLFSVQTSAKGIYNFLFLNIYIKKLYFSLPLRQEIIILVLQV